MAKGPLIKRAIRNEIASRCLENPTLKAKEIQAEMARKYGDAAPGLSAVQKELARIHKDPGRLNKELDQPWSVGSLSKYPIPAESIPTVIELQVMRNNSGTVVGRSFLTIRQAQWVARLAPLLNSIASEIFAENSASWLLLRIAALYARLEQIAELNQETLDTVPLDSHLFIIKDFLKEKDEAKREQLLSTLSNMFSEVI